LPYHNPGSATGLAFDNPKSQKPSPSLRNILNELERDTGAPSKALSNATSYLEHLPSQGVLLLNTALSVERENPGSHVDMWRPFTEELVCQINARLSHVVWVLWGEKAKKYKKSITNPTHKIVEGAHPSPFSAHSGFFGGKFFTTVNTHLKIPIQW
jgi:uracil-DNA glycosylase